MHEKTVPNTAMHISARSSHCKAKRKEYANRTIDTVHNSLHSSVCVLWVLPCCLSAIFSNSDQTNMVQTPTQENKAGRLCRNNASARRRNKRFKSRGMKAAPDPLTSPKIKGTPNYCQC
uniref:Uncharacterized protein n=1 Tax=Odontella aurita TaxID=265563 RepID=A0A7S4JKU4_9STRA|mmetsp:Transcript_48305/g.145978  ORF Transcript_48305/g.145978 Transcript_48305/m.145978 type:complete len:119 (+) Transcript_48305:687-1043(+)